MSNEPKLKIMSQAAESENEVCFELQVDGAICFSRGGAEHFIYLYPSQVTELEALLLLRKSVQ